MRTKNFCFAYLTGSRRTGFADLRESDAAINAVATMRQSRVRRIRPLVGDCDRRDAPRRSGAVGFRRRPLLRKTNADSSARPTNLRRGACHRGSICRRAGGVFALDFAQNRMELAFDFRASACNLRCMSNRQPRCLFSRGRSVMRSGTAVRALALQTGRSARDEAPCAPG